MMGEVRVPYGESAHDTAVALLGAASELELDHHVVKTSTDGWFVVPEEVASKAGLEPLPEEGQQEPQGESGDLQTNVRGFQPVEDSGEQAQQDEPKGLEDMSKQDLEDEIERRNAERDEDSQIKPEGRNKADLVAALEKDNKAQE